MKPAVAGRRGCGKPPVFVPFRSALSEKSATRHYSDALRIKKIVLKEGQHFDASLIDVYSMRFRRRRTAARPEKQQDQPNEAAHTANPPRIRKAVFMVSPFRARESWSAFGVRLAPLPRLDEGEGRLGRPRPALRASGLKVLRLRSVAYCR